MNKFAATALAALMLVAPPALAAQTESGTILVMNPGGSVLFTATEGIYLQTGIEMNGIDGWIIHLEESLAEFSLTGDAGVVGECDLDVWFYDANGGLLDGYENTFDDCNEGGEVPAGATTAMINAWIGFNVGFEFVAE